MGIRQDAAIWIDSISIELRDGIWYAHVQSGGAEFELRARLVTGVEAMEDCTTAYIAHLARTPAQIAKLKG